MIAFTVVAVLLARPAAVAGELSADDIHDAIAAAKNKKVQWCYELESRSRMEKERRGCFTTPFSRVVAAARRATEKYKPFKQADATEDIVRPGELHLYVPAVAVTPKRAAPYVASPIAIVVLPKGSKDPELAIHPTRTEGIPREIANAVDARIEGKDLMAVFPLTVLTEANDVRVIYDQGWGGCTDCRCEIKLDNVR